MVEILKGLGITVFLTVACFITASLIGALTCAGCCSKNKIVRSKIAETLSNFYFDPERMGVYNDVSFELLNDTTMLFILPDNKGYWPDTAIMHRRDRINRKFSNEEEMLLYKE